MTTTEIFISVPTEKGKTMAELIDKWEVVNKLIRLQNQYNFYKNVWDADVLYRRIVELEIGIGKTLGVNLVRCKDCKNRLEGTKMCAHPGAMGWDAIEVEDDDFCSYGERKDK